MSVEDSKESSRRCEVLPLGMNPIKIVHGGVQVKGEDDSHGNKRKSFGGKIQRVK